MRIGIDIGGTHTDAVVVNQDNKIAAFAKTHTTPDIVSGFEEVLKQVPKENVAAVIVGTTHATNAILERRGLSKVGVIRLAGHRPETLPCCINWPKDLKDAVFIGSTTIDGGYNCDGKEITPLNPSQVKEAVSYLMDKGAESLAVVGVFSPINPSQEIEVGELIGSAIPFTLSHQIGGMGIVERENGAILNAALKKVLEKGFRQLEERMVGLTCPLWITQNNGSLVDLQKALQFPLLTLSAGPTNSFVGGAKLADLKDAIVVDVGGTSTDVGIVRKGYPRRCLKQSSIGGVTLNDALPDVQAIALGGGSHIGKGTIGPASSGWRLIKEGIAFGGNQPTLTDIALKLGTITIEGTQPERIMLSEYECLSIIEEAKRMIQKLVEKIGIGETDLPVVMIGGGSQLFQLYTSPPFASVANAYGAAMAEVSHTIDTVISLEKRKELLEVLHGEAIDGAVLKGALKGSVAIVDQKIIPYHYVPGQIARVIVTASGNLNPHIINKI